MESSCTSKGCGKCGHECAWWFAGSIAAETQEEVTLVQIVTIKGGRVLSSDYRIYSPGGKIALLSDNLRQGFSTLKRNLKRTSNITISTA